VTLLFISGYQQIIHIVIPQKQKPSVIVHTVS